MPVVMPDRPSRLMRSSSEFGTSMAERAGAEFSLAFEDNPVPLLFKWSDVASANRRGPYISKADADSIAEQNGVRLNISSSGVSRAALDIMIGDELDRQRKQSIIDRAPSTAGSWVVGKGAGFAAGFADPIGLAANFVPVVGQGTRIAQMANASRMATRLVGRAAVGAVEGAVGAAMFEPLMVAAKHGAGREHGMMDVATDIAGGAAMGGVLHPAVGGFADSYRALTGKAQPWALPGTQPVSPDVQAALDAGRPAEALAASGSVYGRTTRVKVGGDYVPARWAVVDADDAAVAMSKGEGQYRDRTRAASDAQIQGIARSIDFDELHWAPGLDKGAPTLTRDGTIVGGNGRMAAIRLAYDLPSGQAYSIPMRERLQGEFGINPDAVRGMKKPALVRVFERDVDTRAAAVASNEGGTLRMSALEQAKVDGERLGRVDLASADDGRLDVPENRGAIRRWVEQFPDAERAALLDAHGSLSPEGVMRLRNAALHNAFGDSSTLARLVDSTDSGLGRVSSALIKVAGKIADVRAAVGRGELHDIDIATDVLQAVERLANLRENGMPVDVYLRQEDLLGSGLTPEATKILAFLGENLNSSQRMADGILGFYRGVERAGDPSQADLFGGGGVPDRGSLLESSLQAVRDDRSTAEAKLEAVSPQTREAAVSVAASQVMSGKNVDVQPIVDADPAIGTATSEDVLSMFADQDRPEAHRTVDMDASREVAANVAQAPRAWDASHAKLEADAAVLELERLAKNQDEAWKYARAYHGTPAIFPADERGDLGGFRWDKMGTGEGAQAFAFGHYLAQDEMISRKQYRDRLVQKAREAASRNAEIRILDVDALESYIERAEIEPEFQEPIRQIARDMENGITRPQAIWKAFKDFNIGIEYQNDIRAIVDNMLGSDSRYPNVLLRIGEDMDPAWDIGGKVVHRSLSGRGGFLAEAAAQVSTSGYARAKKIFEGELSISRDRLALVSDILKKDLEENNQAGINHGRKQVERFSSDVAKWEGVISALDEVTAPDPRHAGAQIIDEKTKVSDAPDDIKEKIERIAPGVMRDLDNRFSGNSTLLNVAREIGHRLDPAYGMQSFVSADAVASGRAKYTELYPNDPTNVFDVYTKRRVDSEDRAAVGYFVLLGQGISITDNVARAASDRTLRTDVVRATPKIPEVSPGSVYTVEIPDEVEADFLRWDVPFDQQPAKVREAFEAISPGFLDAYSEQPREFNGEHAYRTLSSLLRDAGEDMELFDPAVVDNAFEELKKRRSEEYADGVMRSMMDGTFDQSMSDELVSIMLDMQGVHGQKFLDGNSRGLMVDSPKARFNYVIFNDSTAKLVSRYMRGDGPGQAMATIERMARDAFGDASAGLMEAGRVSVVAHVSDLPGGPHPADVRAMTAPDGRVYMVAENLGSDDVRGILLHEVGVHVGLPQMLGPDGMDSVLRDVDALLAGGDSIALAARKAVPADTPAHLVREETLAYLVQNHPDIGIVRRVIAAVRAWLYEKFPALRSSMKLRSEDLVSLATSAIRRTAAMEDVGAGGVRYSRGGASLDPKSELKPYDDAVEKAGKYAAAVRAAAQRWGDDVAMRAAVEQAAGGRLVNQEIEDLITTLKARHGEIVRGLRKVSITAGAEDRATSLQDAAMAAAEMMAENEERAALVEKRNAALALQAKTRGISYVLSQFPGREAEGMKALLAGSQLIRAGARTSVALEAQQFHGKWLGGLEGDLRKAGLWQFFVEDAYQDDVARALWQHSLEEPDMAGIHPDAVRIADIVNRYQQDAKLTQNRYGAWIGNLRGWMYRQAHDMDKLRAAGLAKWSEYVDARLDWDRIQEQLGSKFDRGEFLRSAFHDLSNGDHFKPASLFEIRPSVGPGNMAKKVSQSRTLHWKDADAATAYLREFGPANGSLAETVLNDFRGSARAAGLMKVLGPNYETNLQAILDHVGETLKGTPAGDKWRSQASEVLDLLHHVDGSISIPHNWLGAKIGAGLRNWQSMAKLGAAVVSQVSDIPVYAAAISHRFDVSIFDGLRDAVSGMLQGRPADERREILADCGHFFESVISQSAARFDPADVPGKMAQHMERFFKWGGITWWAETLRSSAVLTMARRLGDYHGRSFDALPAATRDMLSLYRIDDARWGLLRMAATREVDGNVYLTPEGLRAIPDAALEDHIRTLGREVSPTAVSNLRTDLSDAYRSLLLDQSQYAALEPDARTRAFLLRGTKPGTIGGEILRAFAQFKSFPVVYAQRVLGREVYGRGYDSVGAWAKSRDTKAYMAMFNMLWTLTASGYVAASVKDLLKLRTPRPLDDPRTWLAAFMQGGALGIYGDYLFGSSNRLGGGLIGSVAGPVPGMISQGYDLYQTARDASIEAAMGEDPQPADVASSALNFTLQNTPYLNLHLVRPALNAALIWSLQERLNPGYLQRSKRNLKRNQGSSYLIDPQAVAW